MNGARRVLETARAAGIDTCFANPGTTELDLVVALDETPGIRAVLGLFEGVCTGAADGYGRMRDLPALVLLHHGPGLANGLANLHNARRARSPAVVLVGANSAAHCLLDPPLHSDVESLAAPMCGWVRTSAAASEVAGDTAAAIAAALGPPGTPACLILPWDTQTVESGCCAELPTRLGPVPFNPDAVEVAGRLLAAGEPSAILLGGPALREPGLRAAARIAAKTGARLFCETFPGRVERGGGLPALERLPYFPEAALKALSGARTLVLAGAREPVAFFDYPQNGGRLVPPGTRSHLLATAREDAAAALEGLAERLQAPSRAAGEPVPRPAVELRGAITPDTLGAAIATVQPEGAIIVDEGATSGRPYFGHSNSAPRHSFLALTGGSIGQGLPCATGAAVACSDRPVIGIQADGSAMYTLQALWTQAREGLSVTTVLCANRAYRILQMEMARAGLKHPGPAARSLTVLAYPALDWVALAGGMGVPGVRVESTEELVNALRRSFAEPGPHLIEAVLG
jgi:acetolactate synthase-1/2/3 large subunit